MVILHAKKAKGIDELPNTVLVCEQGDGDFWRISDEVEKVSSKVRGALTAVSIDVTRDAEAKKLLEV